MRNALDLSLNLKRFWENVCWQFPRRPALFNLRNGVRMVLQRNTLGLVTGSNDCFHLYVFYSASTAILHFFRCAT